VFVFFAVAIALLPTPAESMTAVPWWGWSIAVLVGGSIIAMIVAMQPQHRNF
jgi:hypothetical protein